MTGSKKPLSANHGLIFLLGTQLRFLSPNMMLVGSSVRHGEELHQYWKINVI
jgi:hypothetical protein